MDYPIESTMLTWSGPLREGNMPAPISVDLRRRIVALYKLSGVTYEDVAEDLGVGRATVSRVLRLHRETGSVEPAPASGGAPRRLSSSDELELVRMVDNEPDATLQDLAGMWNAAHPDAKITSETVRVYLGRAGYSYKKSRSVRWSKTRSESRR